MVLGIGIEGELCLCENTSFTVDLESHCFWAVVPWGGRGGRGGGEKGGGEEGERRRGERGRHILTVIPNHPTQMLQNAHSGNEHSRAHVRELTVGIYYKLRVIELPQCSSFTPTLYRRTLWCNLVPAALGLSSILTIHFLYTTTPLGQQDKHPTLACCPVF